MFELLPKIPLLKCDELAQKLVGKVVHGDSQIPNVQICYKRDRKMVESKIQNFLFEPIISNLNCGQVFHYIRDHEKIVSTKKKK